MIKITNIIGNSGEAVKNQFVIYDENKTIFQSYDSIICVKEQLIDCQKITLDKNVWDYSRTTSKYRNIFLGLDTKTTKRNIESGKFALDDLNKEIMK
jgi:hypothetical protein